MLRAIVDQFSTPHWYVVTRWTRHKLPRKKGEIINFQYHPTEHEIMYHKTHGIFMYVYQKWMKMYAKISVYVIDQIVRAEQSM